MRRHKDMTSVDQEALRDIESMPFDSFEDYERNDRRPMQNHQKQEKDRLLEEVLRELERENFLEEQAKPQEKLRFGQKPTNHKPASTQAKKDQIAQEIDDF